MQIPGLCIKLNAWHMETKPVWVELHQIESIFLSPDLENDQHEKNLEVKSH